MYKLEVHNQEKSIVNVDSLTLGEAQDSATALLREFPEIEQIFIYKLLSIVTRKGGEL